MNIAVRINDRFVTVDGRKVRYLEEGSGVPAILLHGSSLGSSADVFRRNLRALGAHGIRAIAVDMPGFGKSDPTDDLSNAGAQEIRAAIHGCARARARRADRPFILGRAGGEHRARTSRSHLACDGARHRQPAAAARSRRHEGRRARRRRAGTARRTHGASKEPTLDDTRALLEANLFHHELITDEELNLRHENSIGPCFEEFVRRHEAAGDEGGKGKGTAAPLWQRLTELKMPLLLIYGRNDRARAEERATLLQAEIPAA